MSEQCEARCSGRKNGIWRKSGSVSNMTDGRDNRAQDVSTANKQDEIGPEKLSHIFQAATTVDYSGRIIPQNNSQHQLKKYSRTQSESNVSLQARSGTAKLQRQRALSATELRTRLAGCPQGLLIATEPPTSGETYRRRSNTDVKTVLGKKNLTASSSAHHLGDGLYHKNINSQQVEKEIILLELNAVKREREQLQKENERLQEELENRNKVIDHLIDFMKSSLPEETAELRDNFNETLTNNNLNSGLQSFEKV